MQFNQVSNVVDFYRVIKKNNKKKIKYFNKIK